MRKKTIGFNWGAAGLSNSLWTGAPLREVLFKLGVKEPKEGLFVCFEGPERELPKGVRAPLLRPLADCASAAVATKHIAACSGGGCCDPRPNPTLRVTPPNKMPTLVYKLLPM